MNNSSNYDLQWSHTFSIDLNTFILHNITVGVYTPIPFAHALHMHAKYHI